MLNITVMFKIFYFERQKTHIDSIHFRINLHFSFACGGISRTKGFGSRNLRVRTLVCTLFFTFCMVRWVRLKGPEAQDRGMKHPFELVFYFVGPIGKEDRSRSYMFRLEPRATGYSFFSVLETIEKSASFWKNFAPLVERDLSKYT